MPRSRSFLAAVTLGTLASVTSTAHAGGLGAPLGPIEADAYEPRIGVLFVPTEDVTLTPSSMCPVMQGGDDNAALNCVGTTATEDVTYTVSADEALVTALAEALAPYNVNVVTERPPEYVPYTMLIVTAEVSDTATSRTCTFVASSCDGVDRNDIAITNGGTVNCTDPDPLQTALISFGYLSGLENNDNAMDPMFYPPDFTMPSAAFQDMCSALVPTLDEKGAPNNLQCPSYLHEAHCDMQENQTNSHAELLGVYGDRPAEPDTTAPTIDSFTAPDDGAVLPAGTDLELDAMISDDSGVIGVRWIIASEVFGDMFSVANQISFCTNGACDSGWEGAPFKDPDTPWPVTLEGLPGGEYTVTLETSDLSGNVAETMTRTFMIEGGATEEGNTTDPDTGDADATADNGENNDEDNDGGDTTEGDEETGDGGQTGDGGDDKGCSCTTGPTGGHAGFLLFGLAGLAMTRRRKSA